MVFFNLTFRSVRTIFNLLLVLFTMSINSFINSIKKLENCPCKEDWKLNHGITLSNLFILVSLANIVLPINRVLNSLPLVGNFFIMGYCLLLFTLLYIVTSMSADLSKSECGSCNIEQISFLHNMFKDIKTHNCFYASVGLSIISFYL